MTGHVYEKGTEAEAEASGKVVHGYVITHPHEPYEDAVSIHINQFADGDSPWQAQVYVEGSLVEADYFPSELAALRWAAREVTLIACVSKSPEKD